MPKTLSKKDPNLLEGVKRLDRAQKTAGWLLIGYGLLTQFVSLGDHPIAGLPFIAIGFFCLRWGDPALLAAAAVLFGLSIAPTVNPGISILGPEPVLVLAQRVGWLENIALIAAKGFLAYSAVNQFFLFRLLYGTERATTDDAELALIPTMVANRTNTLARWSRSTAIVSALSGLVALGLRAFDPPAFSTRVVAEMCGALGVVALGLGFGAAFSPTDERRAALIGMGLGFASYVAAIVILLSA
jgi:hypothetical protein